MKELIDFTIKAIQSNSTSGRGLVNGIESGFRDVDKITQGWQKGDLIIIAGRPSMGKTAFIQSMLLNMAIKNQESVGVIYIEGTELQFTTRLISNQCQIPYERVSSGTLDSWEWEILHNGVQKLLEANIYIECPAKIKMDEVSQKAREMVKNHQIKVLFIDYIQLISVVDGYSENRYNEINYISRELKALAKELNIPIIAISELNRNLETDKTRMGKSPTLTDLRDSGTLCDDADVVGLMYRPEYYHITEDPLGNSLIGLAEIHFAKQRKGGSGKANLRFNPQCMKFSDYEEFSGQDNNGFISTTQKQDTPF